MTRPARPRGRCRSDRFAHRCGATSAGDDSGVERRLEARSADMSPEIPTDARVDRRSILEELERILRSADLLTIRGEPRFGHADGFRVTVRQVRGGRLRRPSPPPTPLPAPAPLPRRDGERELSASGCAPDVRLRPGGRSRARGPRHPRRRAPARRRPPDDRHSDALVRRRADVETVRARRAQRLGQLGADDREGRLVQPVQAALVEDRDVRAAAPCAFQLGVDGIIQQSRTAHLVAQATFGQSGLACVRPRRARRPTRRCASAPAPRRRARAEPGCGAPADGRSATPATRMPRAAAGRAGRCRARRDRSIEASAASPRPTRSIRRVRASARSAGPSTPSRRPRARRCRSTRSRPPAHHHDRHERADAAEVPGGERRGPRVRADGDGDGAGNEERAGKRQHAAPTTAGAFAIRRSAVPWTTRVRSGRCRRGSQKMHSQVVTR